MSRAPSRGAPKAGSKGAAGGGAWPSRQPLDLSQPPVPAGQKHGPPRIQGAAPAAPKSRPKQRQGAKPAATATPKRRFKGRAPVVATMSTKARVGAWVGIGLLCVWFVPAFSPAASFVPTPLYLYGFGVVLVALWVLFKQPIAWVVPGLLAALGVIWAGGLAPDLLTGQDGGSPFPLWPEPPATAAASLLWRILALVMAAGTAAIVAFSLAPRPSGSPARRNPRAR